uniref:Uncharacterized protein n=1 Tax=Medicago truncatula TaxID=3880 RepID=A4Q529_MEDTR|nr:hypothetical protein MtrDRAFT_AC161864g33v2 [Medicago truncatula]
MEDILPSDSLVNYLSLKNILQKLLDQDESRKLKQRIGFKNSLIFDTKPTSDGRINQVKFQLTPEIKYQAWDYI